VLQRSVFFLLWKEALFKEVMLQNSVKAQLCCVQIYASIGVV